jgi:hypothetical protein
MCPNQRQRVFSHLAVRTEAAVSAVCTCITLRFIDYQWFYKQMFGQAHWMFHSSTRAVRSDARNSRCHPENAYPFLQANCEKITADSGITKKEESIHPPSLLESLRSIFLYAISKLKTVQCKRERRIKHFGFSLFNNASSVTQTI